MKLRNILERRFRMPPDTVMKKKGGKFLFLNPSAPEWIVTNSNGAIALKLCNGNRTVANIARILSKLAHRDTTEETQNFFHEILSKSRFFTRPNTEICVHQPYNLRIIHLNITNKCNLRCIYCYADERKGSPQTLEFKDYLNAIDSINKISKNVEIVLTGGEPLLSDFAFNVASYAKQKGNQVHLLTNGVLINDKNVEQLSEIFDLIKVSLDGSTPEINDFHRGNGSFGKIMKPVALLERSNANFQISMTVTKRNINDIEAMANRFGSLLTFAPLFKAGRAKKNKGLAISGKEYYNALASVKNVNPMSDLCSALAGAKEQRIMKCAIGDAEISISDTGDVYPCHLLHLPQFLAGNIKEQPFESIYRNSDILKSCRKLTVLEIKGCQKCDIRFICGGACRARAFYEKGRINVSGDFCEYEKLAFINGLFEIHQID